MKPFLFVISAPSGCGKTTLVKKLLEKNKNEFSYSISCTTRPRRKGERDKKDYFFLSENEFKKKIDKSAFIEWAEVYGNYYGTLQTSIEEAFKKGKIVVLDIDVQGAKQIQKNFKDAVFAFILPPSIKVLERRLRDRATDEEDVILQRLKEAEKEIKQASSFDYLVVNDQVSKAVCQIEEIISVEKRKTNRNLEVLDGIYFT